MICLPHATPVRLLRGRTLMAGVLATIALLLVPAAHALGRLTDVQVIDRDSGEVLPIHHHRGEHWVAGRPGARYAIAVRNTTRGRLLNVVSVDGVNVVSGETAAWGQTGYVIRPWQNHEINGWRKSRTEIAAFHFSETQNAYATRTGRPGNLGVIGVAVFREKPARHEPLILSPAPHSPARSAAPSAQSMDSSDAGSHSNDLGETAQESTRQRQEASPAPRLGTGHGEREGSVVGQTRFERLGRKPDEIIRIRYDSHANLVAMGVIPRVQPRPQPNPFPDAPSSGYVPDPS